jgi:hypothetical protein
MTSRTGCLQVCDKFEHAFEEDTETLEDLIQRGIDADEDNIETGKLLPGVDDLAQRFREVLWPMLKIVNNSGLKAHFNDSCRKLGNIFGRLATNQFLRSWNCRGSGRRLDLKFGESLGSSVESCSDCVEVSL